MQHILFILLMLRGAIQTHRCQHVNEKLLCYMEERKYKLDNDKIKRKNSTNEKSIKTENYEEMQ